LFDHPRKFRLFVYGPLVQGHQQIPSRIRISVVQHHARGRVGGDARKEQKPGAGAGLAVGVDIDGVRRTIQMEDNFLHLTLKYGADNIFVSGFPHFGHFTFASYCRSGTTKSMILRDFSHLGSAQV